MSSPLPSIGDPLRVGEVVEITCDGRTVDGIVVFASPNGRSLILKFDAMLTGHVGAMPVFQETETEFRAIMDGAEVTVTRK